MRLAPAPSVIADAQALSRAIGNLLSNALRLAPPHSEVTVASGSEAGWAWVAVRDEGPGIADEEQERVFHRVWACLVDDGLGRATAGAGQAARSLEAMVAASHLQRGGVGSTFVLWLPDRASPHGSARPYSARERPVGTALTTAPALRSVGAAWGLANASNVSQRSLRACTRQTSRCRCGRTVASQGPRACSALWVNQGGSRRACAVIAGSRCRRTGWLRCRAC